MSIFSEPVAIALILLLFIVVDRRLKSAAQPLRLRLAEKGEEFLARPDVSDAARKHVNFLLDHAFSMRRFLLMAIVMIPFTAVLFVVSQKTLLRSVDKLKTLSSTDKASFFEICRIHDRITLTNHYILFPIVEFELVLFMPLAILLSGIIQGRIPETGGRESVVTYIEDKSFRGIGSYAVASN